MSRDRAAQVVSTLERPGIFERHLAERAHLVALVEEHPIKRSLRDIERTRERSIDALRQAATSISPAPAFMAIYGSWARVDAMGDSDLDVAVIAEATTDHDALFGALDECAARAGRITGRQPSLLIAERPSAARGPVGTSVRRDGIVLVNDEQVHDGARGQRPRSPRPTPSLTVARHTSTSALPNTHWRSETSTRPQGPRSTPGSTRPMPSPAERADDVPSVSDPCPGDRAPRDVLRAARR